MTTKEITINIYKIIGGKAAVSTDYGQKVFENISEILKSGNTVILDFMNIEIILTAFLNVAIGQLYKDFDAPFLKGKLKVTNLSDEDLQFYKEACERGNEYYKNPTYRKILNDSLKKVLDDEQNI